MRKLLAILTFLTSPAWAQPAPTPLPAPSTTQTKTFIDNYLQNVPPGQGINAGWLNSILTTMVNAIAVAAGGLAVGTTAVSAGTDTRVLYDNAGVLGEYTISGTGSVAMTASPVFTGTPTIPTPFTLGAVSVTATGTQLNYLAGATGTTGTTTTNVVFSTSPTLVTPVLGVATGTSLALGGCTIGSNAFCTTGTSALGGATTFAGAITFTADGTFNIGAAASGRPASIFSSAFVTAGNSGGFFSSSRGGILFPADGVFNLTDNATTAFTRLNLGPATSSFPALKRSTTILQVRLADDSAYAPIEALTVRASGYTVGTLPAAGTAGRTAYVTDQAAACVAPGAALTGGGAVVCPVFDNGSAWVGG